MMPECLNGVSSVGFQDYLPICVKRLALCEYGLFTGNLHLNRLFKKSLADEKHTFFHEEKYSEGIISSNKER